MGRRGGVGARDRGVPVVQGSVTSERGSERDGESVECRGPSRGPLAHGRADEQRAGTFFFLLLLLSLPRGTTVGFGRGGKGIAQSPRRSWIARFIPSAPSPSREPSIVWSTDTRLPLLQLLSSSKFRTTCEEFPRAAGLRPRPASSPRPSSSSSPFRPRQLPLPPHRLPTPRPRPRPRMRPRRPECSRPCKPWRRGRLGSSSRGRRGPEAKIPCRGLRPSTCCGRL